MFTKRNFIDRIYESNRNLIVNGDISSGKTSNFIFPLIDRFIDNDENILILDSKEEYINKYYGYLKGKDYNLIVVNLQDLDRSNGWNPLTYPYTLYKMGNKDKALEYLEKISKNIFQDPSSNDSFWISSARDLFLGLCFALFDSASPTEINYNSINNMVGYPKLKDFILSFDKDSIVYNCASGTILSPKETKDGIISTFRQQLRKIISKEKLTNLLYKTNFNYESLINNKYAFFIIARDDNKELNIIASMLIEQIFSYLFDEESHKKNNIILDNIDTIEYIPELSNMLASGISRDIKFVIGTRFLDNINNKYGEYINKLCNILNINDKNIELILNNKYEKIRYTPFDYKFVKDNINYPILTNEKIKTFDFENNNIIDNNNQEQENEIKPLISDNLFFEEQKEEPKEISKLEPIYDEPDPNFFSVYEEKKRKIKEKEEKKDKLDSKEEINKSSNTIDEETAEIIKKIDKKLTELKSEDNISKIDSKIKEIERKTIIKSESNDFFNQETNNLLNLIDQKIKELEQENKKNLPMDFEFPNLDEKNIKKPKIKNKLAHYKEPKEINPKEEIKEEVENILKELNLIKEIDGKIYYVNGYKNKKKEIEAKLLKEKYNIEPKKESKSIFWFFLYLNYL